MRQPLILDAGCVINLYATGRLREIAESCGFFFLIADFVYETECNFVKSIDGSVREPIDISELVTDGIIEITKLNSPSEEEVFVDLAQAIDEGEAISAAIALSRGLAIGTDDRTAWRHIERRTEAANLFSTLGILRSWIETARVSNEELKSAVELMASRASFVPSRRDQEFCWLDKALKCAK